jgi:hypothetical protein
MGLTPDAHIGPYEIVAAIGIGGMGEVYRARDARLSRDVALKVLPASFATDPDRLARFEREMKTLASLNHPNIAHVYDAGRDASVVFMTMELVEGEDLAARISHGAIPLAEALPIARQIADALAAAHEIGVIHRDLKPANIKVRPDGTVKVLDFGLAKAVSPDGESSAAAMNSPTLTARGTEIGMIIGTAAYMAPEQARGKAVDRRADLWAFGVVLYEMLTGRRAFDGSEVSDVLASVLKDTPSLDALPAEVPPNIRRLLRRTLEKDRARRLDSMAAARLELDEPPDASASPPPAVAVKAAPRARLWAIAGAGVVAAFALGWIGSRVSSPTPRADVGAAARLVAQLAAPREAISAFHDGFALSPDGLSLVFAMRDTSGARQIWIRGLDATTPRPVPGTDNGAYPFWAPDGRSFAFFADGNLRRVGIDGGQLQTICAYAGAWPQGSWNAHDEILFAGARGKASRIMRVSSAGGTPVPIDGVGTGIGPTWLSDGRRFLFAGGPDDATWALRLASTDGKDSQVIAPLSLGTKAYAYGGGLVFLNKNDTLAMQRFDESAGALTGAVVPIAGRAGTPKEWFAVSIAGQRVAGLVRQYPGESGDPGDPMARLIWVDRQGNVTGSLGDPGHYWTVRLAPDGTRAMANPGSDLWLLRPDGRHTRFTTGGESDQSFAPVWSRDGSEVAYVHENKLVRRRVDGQSAESILTGAHGYVTDWSPDGRWLLTTARPQSDGSSIDIFAHDLQANASHAWLSTALNEGQARFSPDGRWVAYVSDESGRQEVYIRSFEGSGPSAGVSMNGGSHPIWRHDGSELFFLDPNDDVMVASVSAPRTPGKPQRLFRIPLNDITRGNWAPYDVAPDGQHFLLNVTDRPTPLFFLQGVSGLFDGKR